MLTTTLPWREPLEFAAAVDANSAGENWAFLYSGLSGEVKNSVSYLALFPKNELVTDNFSDAKTTLNQKGILPPYLGGLERQSLSQKGEMAGETHQNVRRERLADSALLNPGKPRVLSEAKSCAARGVQNGWWLGYLSYELGQEFEQLPKTKKSHINLPKIWLINFSLIFHFDHQQKKLTAFFEEKEKLAKALSYKAPSQQPEYQIKVTNLASNFSDESYLRTISSLKKMIARGDFYQTNLTRKFFGELEIDYNPTQHSVCRNAEAKLGSFSTQKKRPSWSSAFQSPSNFLLFQKLTTLSPANYSAFLSFGNTQIISASPELFLSRHNNILTSRPIKGTAPRSPDKASDEKNKNDLAASEKEKAENLMIVDLVRHDLSKLCKPGSVQVDKLFDVTTYSTLHHLSSEISGTLKEQISNSDILQACFPPGSMTGAPKIKAMEIAAKKEKLNRGVYSGSIALLDPDGNFDSSVVIRTLILQRTKQPTGSGTPKRSSAFCELEKKAELRFGVPEPAKTNYKFEFQVGGAITFDSDEKKELAEAYTKASAILDLLSLKDVT